MIKSSASKLRLISFGNELRTFESKGKFRCTVY